MDINVLKTGSIYKGYQTLTGHGIILLFFKNKMGPFKKLVLVVLLNKYGCYPISI